jgi:chemotaxis methyl-accepting protein methylase
MESPYRKSAAPLSWSGVVNWISAHDVALHRLIGERIPPSLAQSSLGLGLGRFIQRTVQRYARREQSTTTYFLRNRPELALMGSALQSQSPGARIDIAVLGCSKGAEVYSIVWVLRNARPDLDLRLHAVDINKEIVEFAQQGVYSLLFCNVENCTGFGAENASTQIAARTLKDQPSSPFERMTESEFNQMFELSGNDARVRPHLREGISWHAIDANAADLPEVIGRQDIVFANRFLCHMQRADAEKCLKNAMALVKPGGYLFVSGIDLEVRAHTATRMGWRPVTKLIREIHEGDPSVLTGWPLKYWGLEPFDNRRHGWESRYAAVFQNSADASTDKSSQPVMQREPPKPSATAASSHFGDTASRCA